MMLSRMNINCLPAYFSVVSCHLLFSFDKYKVQKHISLIISCLALVGVGQPLIKDASLVLRVPEFKPSRGSLALGGGQSHSIPYMD